MGDWTLEQVYRDFWSKPLAYPLLRLYSDFMSIKRYDRMPFYFAPVGGKVVNYENILINYIDWLIKYMDWLIKYIDRLIKYMDWLIK